jgi:uncharacterized protein YjbI with pentapeptide repeats
MRVLKPQSLSVLHRCFERQYEAWLCVSVVAFLPMEETPALLSEQEMWRFVLETLPEDCPLDAAMPKVGGEFLIVGDACVPPPGEPLQGLKVEARVGALAKTLHVLGPRAWTGRSVTSPQPFSRMPLDWAHTLGGPGLPENPLGVGAEAVPGPDGQPWWPLPSVEPPDATWQSPQRPSRPASFMPIPSPWPQRMRWAGTYDAEWMKNHYPGLPPDMNWRYHCMASEDQWQPEPFRGDEAYEVIHMHPQYPRLAGRLPGLRAVVGVRTRDMDERQLRMLDCRLTTVWLFPTAQRMALVWHAMTQVDDEFADRVENLLVGCEWLHEAKGPQHYLEALNARLDPEQGAVRMLDDEDLLPAGLACRDPSLERFKAAMGQSGVRLARLDEQLAKSRATLRAQLGEAAVAAAPSGPAVPSLAELQAMKPAQGMALLKRLEQQTAQRAVRPPRAGIGALPRPAGAGKSATEALKTLRDLDRTGSKSAALKRLEQVIDAAAKGAPPSLPLAHMLQAPSPLPPETAARWREGAMLARQQGRSFAGMVLHSADFSGMDLSGADFTRAALDGADLRGADLRGARFTETSLAHARLDGARLDNAVFDRANLGGASLAKASLVGCSFAEATLHGTVLDDATLFGSSMKKVTLHEVRAAGTQWVQADLSEAVILRSRLPKAGFSRSTLAKASFIECDLAGADFSSAVLASADFVQCQLPAAVFDQCDGTNLRALHGTAMPRTSFRSARLPGACLRGIDLQSAVFTGCLMDGADLSEAQCTQAHFGHASLKAGLLIKTRLERAVLVHTNLMQAVAQHACLLGADVRGANLFAADLMRIEVDEATRFDAAFLAKARTHPSRRVQPARTSKGAA